MRTHSRLTCSALGLAAIGLLFNLAGAGEAIGASSKDVIVVNTPTVEVVSLPTVTAQDRDAPARQPFQHFGTFEIQAPAFGGADSFAVPAGKRLVIEYINIRSNIAAGGNKIVSFSLGNQGGGSLGGFGFVPQTTIVSAVDTIGFIAHEQLRAYCDPGTDVTVSAIRNSAVGSDAVSYTVTGFLVDIP